MTPDESPEMSFQADARSLRQAITSFGTISSQVCGIADLQTWTWRLVVNIDWPFIYLSKILIWRGLKWYLTTFWQTPPWPSRLKWFNARTTIHPKKEKSKHVFKTDFIRWKFETSLKIWIIWIHWHGLHLTSVVWQTTPSIIWIWNNAVLFLMCSINYTTSDNSTNWFWTFLHLCSVHTTSSCFDTGCVWCRHGVRIYWICSAGTYGPVINIGLKCPVDFWQDHSVAGESRACQNTMCSYHCYK